MADDGVANVYGFGFWHIQHFIPRRAGSEADVGILVVGRVVETPEPGSEARHSASGEHGASYIRNRLELVVLTSVDLAVPSLGWDRARIGECGARVLERAVFVKELAACDGCCRPGLEGLNELREAVAVEDN